VVLSWDVHGSLDIIVDVDGTCQYDSMVVVVMVERRGE
jgi:hypothetical protein